MSYEQKAQNKYANKKAPQPRHEGADNQPARRTVFDNLGPQRIAHNHAWTCEHERQNAPNDANSRFLPHLKAGRLVGHQPVETGHEASRHNTCHKGPKESSHYCSNPIPERKPTSVKETALF